MELDPLDVELVSNIDVEVVTELEVVVELVQLVSIETVPVPLLVTELVDVELEVKVAPLAGTLPELETVLVVNVELGVVELQGEQGV